MNILTRILRSSRKTPEAKCSVREISKALMARDWIDERVRLAVDDFCLMHKIPVKQCYAGDVTKDGVIVEYNTQAGTVRYCLPFDLIAAERQDRLRMLAA